MSRIGSTRRLAGGAAPGPLGAGSLVRQKAAVMTRFQAAFGALVPAQAVHSVEEYVGRLWESFPPARFLTGLIGKTSSADSWSSRCRWWHSGSGAFSDPCVWDRRPPLPWVWVAMDVINGIGHSRWTLRQGGYTPGVATAPVLLALTVYLALQLSRKW